MSCSHSYLPSACEFADADDHAAAQLALALAILQRLVHRLAEDVLDLVGMHDAHPAAPLRRAGTLQVGIWSITRPHSNGFPGVGLTCVK